MPDLVGTITAFQMFRVASAVCSDVWTCCQPRHPERLSPARATWQRWGLSSHKVSQHSETSHPRLELQNVSTAPTGLIPPHRIPARMPRERHRRPFLSLPSLLPFLRKQISVAHFSHRLWGLTLLWINRYTSDCAFNTVKSRGTAQRAALCSTCAPCYLQVAAFPAGKASGSPFLFPSWSRSRRHCRPRRRRGTGSWERQLQWKGAQRLFARRLGGSGPQRPRVSTHLGHPRHAGSLGDIVIKPQWSGKSTAQAGNLWRDPRGFSRAVVPSHPCIPQAGTLRSPPIPASPGREPCGPSSPRGSLVPAEPWQRQKGSLGAEKNAFLESF